MESVKTEMSKDNSTSETLNEFINNIDLTFEEEKQYACDICQKMFSQRSNLARHKKTHISLSVSCQENLNEGKGKSDCETNIVNSCDSCDKVFTSKENLDLHVKSHKKPFPCDLCEKSYTRKDKLSTHKLSHTGEKLVKKFTCEECFKKFALSHHLKEHIQTHTGEKNYSCNVCQKSFLRNQHLNRHNKTKDHKKQVLLYFDVNPCSCDICEKKFKTRHHLNEHYKSHINLYSCDVCDKFFSTLSELKKHEKSTEHVKKEEDGKGDTHTDVDNNIDFSEFVSVEMECEETVHDDQANEVVIVEEDYTSG